MVEPGKGSIILRALQDRLGVDAVDVSAAAEAYYGERSGDRLDVTRVINGIAVIPVYGTLIQRRGMIDAMSGVVSYEALGAEIAEAVHNDDILGILLDIDSPGGEVAGCFGLADTIVAAAKVKPVWAVANEAAFSAAYAIAASTQKIYVGGKTAGVGSIGVVAWHMDYSQAVKAAGVKPTPFYAGARKVDGNPYQPLSKEATKEFSDRIGATYQIFVDHVAAARGMKAADVRATEARLYFGGSGVRAGLADEIGTLEDALSAMISEFGDSASATEKPRVQKKENPMPVETDAKTDSVEVEASAEVTEVADVAAETAAEDAAETATETETTETEAPDEETPAPERNISADAAAIVEAVSAAGLPASLSAGLIRAGSTIEAATARIAVVSEIRQVCKLANAMNMADELSACASLAEAKVKLFDALASRSEETAVSTIQKPAASSGAQAQPLIDANAIYARINERK
jgi:signal peptide peptidase SppA